MTLRLASIHIYPIKSLGGFAVHDAQATERGFARDRRYMLIDANGRFLSQREAAQMACLHCTENANGFTVTNIRSDAELDLPWSVENGQRITVRIWDDTLQATLCASEYSQWFSAQLKLDARLVYMPEESLRVVDRTYAEGIVSFADGYPFLILSHASLNDLNARLGPGNEVPMNRFRPSIVIDGGTAFQEDTWIEVLIGELTFDLVKPCGRCIITTTDQTTGQRNKEPLSTLTKYRKDLGPKRIGKIDFGMNALARNHGELTVGDAIVVKHTTTVQ